MDELEKLYSELFTSLCESSMNIVQRTDIGEDIVQESFIAFENNKHTIKDKKKYENWMRRTVRNKSIDYFRSNIQKRNTLSIDDLPDNYNGNGIRSVQVQGSSIIEIIDRDSNILERIIETDSTKMLDDAVNKLTPKYRQIYKMHELQGIKHKIIAEELGISEGTSKSNLNKARKRLKIILTDEIIP